MEKTKVWWVNGTYIDDPTICFTRGDAKNLGGNDIEYDFAYTGDLNDRFDNQFFAYRVFHPNLNTPWCFTEEEANRAADEMGVPSNDEEPRHIMRAHAMRPRLKPLTLPVTQYLYKNDRGLYCRLNLHPEIDGSFRVNGKLFFPDRSCADTLCEGYCVITETNDKGNYGFFKGHMQQFKAPSDELLDEYIREHGLYDRTLRYMSGKFGTYVETIWIPDTWTTGYITDNRVLVETEDGKIEEYANLGVDPNARVTKEISVADYLCEGYHGCKFDKLFNSFVRVVFNPGVNASVSDKYISDLLDDAVTEGMLQTFAFQNVFYVNVTSDGLARALMSFSRDEMSELIQTVNKINQTANDIIRGKIKRGKISII